MNQFNSLFSDWRTSFYTVALGLVVATLFAVRVHPSLPLNAIAIILLGLAWFLEGKFRSKLNNLIRSAYLAPLVLYALYLIGIVYSDNSDIGWQMAEHKLAMLLAPVLIAGSSSFRKEHSTWALFVFVNSAILAMVVAFVLAFLNGLENGENLSWIDRLTYQKLGGAIVFQPIYLSLYLVFAFFATMALCFSPQCEGQWFYRNKTRAYPAMAFFFFCVVMLSSRMELMVLFATAGALTLFFAGPLSKQWKYWAAMFGLLLVAGTIIFSSAENRLRFTEMFDFSADYTENQYGGRSIRIEKWKNTTEAWSENWLLGVGSGDMQEELNKTYKANNFEIAYENSFNPHNQYLQTGLTIGLVGFAVLMFWMIGLIAHGLIRRNWLLFAFGIIVSLSMITESMMERHWGVVFISFFSIILLRENFDYFRREANS